MSIILLLLLCSIIVGAMVGKSDKKNIIEYIGDKVSLTVLLLLFVFGVTIGGNAELMADIGRLGATAVAISSACIFGSVLFALFIDRCCRKK